MSICIAGFIEIYVLTITACATTNSANKLQQSNQYMVPAVQNAVEFRVKEEGGRSLPAHHSLTFPFESLKPVKPARLPQNYKPPCAKSYLTWDKYTHLLSRCDKDHSKSRESQVGNNVKWNMMRDKTKGKTNGNGQFSRC